MKMNTLVIGAACAALLSSCAATVPLELTNAREAYRRASNGPAAQVAPAELHVANQALAQAELSFQKNPDSYQTRDLAYVAGRKSELATATASINIQQAKEAQAKNDFQTAQGKIVKDTKEDLNQTRTALTAAEQTGAATSRLNSLPPRRQRALPQKRRLPTHRWHLPNWDRSRTNPAAW